MNRKWKAKLEKIKEKSDEKNGPQNDKNPNIIRLPGVWQPGNNQTLDPLGKSAILAFGAIAIAEIVHIGAEAVPENPILGGAILAAGIWGAMTWWNIAQTPTR